MRKIGILTGGGDCPGLNAVIRGVVARCMREDIAVFGFYAGWGGVLENEGRWLTRADVEGIQTLGGTILGSSRTNVMKFENGPEVVREAMERLDLEGLVAVGGDDTLGVANTLRKLGMNMIGVPKTIDNDLSCTDWTFGFDTASNIAAHHGRIPRALFCCGVYGAAHGLDHIAGGRCGKCTPCADSGVSDVVR